MGSFFRYVLGSLMVIGSILSCANQKEKDVGATDPHIEKYFNLNWAENKFWDDGLAEVATYAAERVIYNQVRTFDFTLISVKEDFNEEFQVKTDDYKRKDLYPVIKVNQFCRIPTDQYPYHFQTSLFFHRRNPVALFKLTSSSQEWCGNTFKAVTDEGNKFNFEYNSYWDGQGQGNMQLQKNILFEDQLPYTLRSLKFKEGLRFSAAVAELMQTNKATKPTIYPADFIVQAAKTESGKPAWRVTVQLNQEKQNSYIFEAAYPNILVAQRTWDGRKLQLKEIRRYAYWQH